MDELWDKISMTCRRMNRVKGDVFHILQMWEIDPFQCAILNHPSKLTPSFLVWSVWKE